MSPHRIAALEMPDCHDIVNQMARFLWAGDAVPILEVANDWKKRCWIGDDSILFPGEKVWALDNVQNLYAAFVENPQTDKRSFLEKLKGQIATAPNGTVKLAAEMLWLLLLWELDMLATTKIGQMTEVLSWCKASLNSELPAVLALQNGVARPGQGYRQRRPFELQFFIELSQRWKPLRGDQREALLQPWIFADWLDETPTEEPRALRHILLFFLFPDEFEPISSGKHKRAIRDFFINEDDVQTRFDEISSAHLSGSPNLRLDQELLAIRRALEAK